MTVAIPPDLLRGSGGDGGGGTPGTPPRVIDVTRTGLPTMDASARGKLFVNNQSPAGWMLHEVPQTATDPQGHWFRYGDDVLTGYAASDQSRSYTRDLDLGVGASKRVVATAATLWIIDGTDAIAYHTNTLTRDHDKDIDLGSGTWRGGTSDGTTVWFLDDASNFMRGYTALGGRDSSEDIDLGNGNWTAAASNGNLVWVVDNTANRATAYIAATRARQSSSDINLGTGNWTGAVCDGTTIWFLDNTDDEAVAYTASTRAADSDKDIDLPSAFWAGAATDETTLWFIHQVDQGHYIGEFASDAAATAAGWTDENDWYYNTSDRAGYRIDRVSGSLRRQAHSMTTLLGADHIWMGHGDTLMDLLQRIDSFDSNTTYVGEVGNHLYQLYNGTYVAGNDGHTLFDAQLIFGLGTPRGLVTQFVAERTASMESGTVYRGTGLILPSADDAEWIAIHMNSGEWHFNRISDYANVNTASAGDDPDSDNAWDRIAEITIVNNAFAVRFFYFGITDTGELLVASNSTATIETLEIRSIPSATA